MNKISVNNYESFLVDYLDGTLCFSDRQQVELFLQQHPQILQQFTTFANSPKLTFLKTQLPAAFKLNLKKHTCHLSSKELNVLLIKELENNLTEEEKTLLAQQQQTPFLKKEKLLITATKLEPDFNITFPNKEKLKKKTVSFFYYTSIAASLLIIVGLYFLFTTHQLSKKSFSVKNNQEKLSNLLLSKNKFSFKNNNTNIQNVSNTQNNLIVKKEGKIKNKNLLELIPYKSEKIIINQQKYDTLQVIQQEITLVKSNPQNELTAVSNSDFLTIKEFVRKKIKQSASGLEKQAKIENSQQKIDQYDIASLVIKKIAKLSGKKLQLERMYHDNGELKEIALIGENFELSKKK